MTALRERSGAALDAATLYAILRLRVEVFVVEQACPYPELDGRDLAVEVRHCWVEEAGGILAYLRVEPDAGGVGHRIRRVCTAAGSRGRGLAATLIDHAMETTPGPLSLSAQTYLAGWYRQLGFREVGDPFEEDGISHVEMRLDR